MRHFFPGTAFILAGTFLTNLGLPGLARAQEQGRSPARAAIEPIAPALPRELVMALQSGKFLESADELAKMVADPKWSPDERAYLLLIRSTALRLGQKLDDARRVVEEALAQAPDTRWAAKLKSELIANHLVSGRFADAEKIARSEVDRLLANDRKDRLAEFYQHFARKLLQPDDPTTPPDPENAYALLSQARELAKGPELRATLLLAMGRASMKGGNPARALENYQLFLKEYPGSSERFTARFELGEAQLASGLVQPARLTWTDLSRALEGQDSKLLQELRGRCLFQISRTYGIPAPPDDTSLNLGLAALQRMLDGYPDHPLSVQAAYDLAASNQSRGKSEAALAAFRDFIAGKRYEVSGDEARTLHASLQMSAQFQIAQILQGQEKFNDAIAAWKDYLARFPNGPQSADAQRAIVDTQILIGSEHHRKKEYDAARTAWQLFVTQNPLDPRVPQILFQIGESFVPQEKFDDAIAAWELLAGKFPGTEPAAHGEFLIASIYEEPKGDPATAIDRFRKVNVEPWASQARHSIAVMEAKALTVITPRAFRTGETPQLKITTRNIDKLTFTAYKLDVEAYFRKKHVVSEVEALDIGLVQPDAEWVVDVPGYDKYKPIEKPYDLGKLEVPGVYVVKVTDDKTLQATTLVLASDIDAIFKVSKDQLLAFVQDMKTGLGRPGARVLVSDGASIILDGKTGPDGVLLADWKEPRTPDQSLTYIILDGPHAAGSDLNVPERVAQGLSPRAYLYTDRPAYRPGNTVELRGIVREVEKSEYAHRPGQTYKLQVFDSRGRALLARDITLSDFGTFATTIPLDTSAPLGVYRVRLYQPGKSEFGGQFLVQAYQLQKLDLTIDLPRTIYFRGETLQAKAIAKYQYGTPLAGRDILVNLPDGRTLNGKTDAAGEYAFEFATEGFAEEQELPLVAQLPQDGVAVQVVARLAIRAFQIRLATNRDVYLDGESFPVDVTTTDALGKPTRQPLTLTILKQAEQAGRTVERQVRQIPVETAEADGKASVPVKIDDPQGGTYILRAAGTDRFGNPIVHDFRVLISGKDDEQKLRILTDTNTFKVSQTAQVNLHSRLDAGTVLLAWEADRILQYKLVPINQGDNPVSWPVEPNQFPNFTLTAARMADTSFHQASADLYVKRDLKVQIKPRKTSVAPGEEVVVDVTTLDQLDRPVPAELSLALVDRALLRLHPDALVPIDTFFHSQLRTAAFETQSTNTFKYEPPTQPVSEAVVEDQEQLLARELEERERVQVMAAMPAPKAPPVAAFNGAFIDGATETRLRSGRGGTMMGAMGGGMGSVGGPARDKQRGALAFGVAASDDGEESSREAKDALALGEDRKSDAAEKGKAYLGRPISETLARRRVFAKEADSTSEPRQQFVETAYWNPAVKTGPDGKGSILLKAPTALSEYQFSARGTTGPDTLVGQATASLSVSQDFFVDIKLPATLTEGDSVRFPAQLHHRNVKGKANVVLTLYAGGREQKYPRELELTGDGVTEILFDSYTVPNGDLVQLSLEATAENASDKITTRFPIRPWGVQAFATASGSAEDDTTVFVSLPQGRPYESPEMMIVLSPSLRRMIVELALGYEFSIMDRRLERCLPPMPTTTADRASEALGVASALAYLRAVGGSNAPEATRLSQRLSAQVAELVTLQNDDGGWPWVPSSHDRPVPSDPSTSATAYWALAEADKLGLVPDASAFDRGSAYLKSIFAQVDVANHDTRAAILHTLSTRSQATFEQVNALNRQRQAFSDVALAYLALTFANLDRASLGAEVLDVLGPRAKRQTPKPGDPPLVYWDGTGRHPWVRSATETTALAALAFARVRPGDNLLPGAIAWLNANRHGLSWHPSKAKGPALAALSAFYGHAQALADRYRLTVTVNDQQVQQLDVQGNTEGTAIRVPIEHIKPGAPNRVHFDLEGRGNFGYAVTLTGFARDFKPDQDRTGKSIGIHRRVYWAPEPTLDGKPLAQGFSVAVNPNLFENTISQLALGGKTTISVEAWRNQVSGQPDWERDYLIIEETLPAGTRLIEGSMRTQAGYHEFADGVLRLYFTPDQYPGLTYEVFGYLPGNYRALPPVIRSAYEPGKLHLGAEGNLAVLDPGKASTDPYEPTPDELYARGKTLFDLGRLPEAAEPLETLWNTYSLREDVAKEAARMLLSVNLKQYNARNVVKYFEILKEKSPELVIPFEEIKLVGRAYADIGEHERAWLVWRATAEASYLEDARVGEVLRQRGQTLEGLALLLDLWRGHPTTASIQNDFFGLSAIFNDLANRSITDPPLRRELVKAEVTGPQLLAQQIRLIQIFLSLAPTDPVADEASLAEVGAFLELEDFPRVVKLAEGFSRLYPQSKFLDSFVYSQALGHFNLAEYDQALGLAERIAKAVYKDAAGVEQPSPNKWEAIYILGQIHDARRQPELAVGYYRQVADRFGDAASAIKELTRKSLSVPEVAVFRPKLQPEAPAIGGVGLRTIAAQAPSDTKPTISVNYRNLPEVDLKVYAVDLMRLYLTRRNLDSITGIDLAGIKPLVEQTVKLGSGEDYADKAKELDIPLDKEGAYLIMARGENLYASGIVLVSPIELEVLEESPEGRVRVRVVDARTKAFLPKVQVKVIGSDMQSFVSGETDLRGIFVAEGVRGTVSAVARKGTSQYAFYRGKTYVGQPAEPRRAPGPMPGRSAEAGDHYFLREQSLDQNFKMLNDMNRSRQLERLQQRYNTPAEAAPGVQVDQAR